MFHAVLFDLFETLVTESGSSPVRASHLATRLRIDPEGYRSEWKRRRPDIVLEYSSLRQALIDIGSALERTIEESTLAAIINNRIHDKTAVLQSVEPIVGMTACATELPLKRAGGTVKQPFASGQSVAPIGLSE